MVELWIVGIISLVLIVAPIIALLIAVGVANKISDADKEGGDR